MSVGPLWEAQGVFRVLTAASGPSCPPASPLEGTFLRIRLVHFKKYKMFGEPHCQQMAECESPKLGRYRLLIILLFFFFL